MSSTTGELPSSPASRGAHELWGRVPTPAAAVLGLLALTIVAFHRQVFDHWTFPYDFLATYTESPPFVASSVASGHLFSWSPFVAGGSPTGINVQSGLYFPLWWVAGLLHITLTLSVLTDVQVLHVFAAGVGMLLLARTRGLRVRWALAAAVAYVLFGGFYGESEHADAFRGFAYLPWLLWSLTIPAEARWIRVCGLPLIAWLIFAGAYPGQTASFGILGFVYLVSQLYGVAGDGRQRAIRALVLPVLAALAVGVAVLLPYLLASHEHDLVRPVLPTAAARAAGSLSLEDLLGLYLNPFSWHQDATIVSWSIGVPILVGLACVRSATIRRQVTLLPLGIVAVLFGFGGKWGLVAKLMADLPSVFPSRFPEVEYKAGIALVLILLSADAWAAVAERRLTIRPLVPLGVGMVLLAGLALAPHTYADPTRTVWLVVLTVLASVALVLLRPPVRIFCIILVTLIAVDGYRCARDLLLDGTTSPWLVSQPVAASIQAPASYVRDLPQALQRAPARRPARRAPVTPALGGTNADSFGWVADGYLLSDYSGTVDRSRALAETTPAWSHLMLEPWHAYTFSCAAVSCAGGHVRLPSTSRWHPSSAVTTTSYSIRGIVYTVHVQRPTLMVENELSVPGWSASNPRVQAVDAGIPLRAWRLTPGNYTFRATFHQPGRHIQVLAAAAALVLSLIAIALALLPRTRPAPRPGGPVTA